MCEVEANSFQYPTIFMSLTGHEKSVTDVSFSPKTNQLLSSSEDCTLRLWDMTPESRNYSFSGHTDEVTTAKFSPNGELMASSSKDTTVRLCVPSITGECASFKAHTSAINCICFSPDSSKLISSSNDKCIKLWNVASEQFLSSFVGHTGWVKSAKYSPEGNYIVSGAVDRTIRVWDVDSGQCVHAFAILKNNPTCISIHKNNNTIAVAMDSGSVRLYDIRAKKLQQHYAIHDYSTCVSWHPSAYYFISSGKDGKIVIVNIMEGSPIFTLKNGHKGSVNVCEFNSDGKYFASGGVDQNIVVWDTNFTNS